MTKNEFLEKMDEYGIKLGKYQIIVDEYAPVSYYLGIYRKGKEWVIYDVKDRNQVMVLHKGNSENEVYDEFYNTVFVRLNIMGFINNGIDKKTVQTPKSYVCAFLQKKYNISKLDAEDTWNYLLYDFHVLNEVKYFALNNKFVPEDDCYRVEGYSAEDIADELGLNVIDSYKYSINLEKDSDRYLPKIKMMESQND